MAKHLRQIIEKENIQGKDTKLKGVKSSKTEPMDIADLNDSPGNQKFAKDHTIEKHADRVGNGEEDYKGKTKQNLGDRHGHIGKKSKEVYSKYNEETATDNEPRFKGKKLLTDKKKDLEEREMTSAEMKKEKKLKTKYDPSGMKKSMMDQYGSKKGKEIYFAKIRKEAMSKKKE